MFMILKLEHLVTCDQGTLITLTGQCRRPCHPPSHQSSVAESTTVTVPSVQGYPGARPSASGEHENAHPPTGRRRHRCAGYAPGTPRRLETPHFPAGGRIEQLVLPTACLWGCQPHMLLLRGFPLERRHCLSCVSPGGGTSVFSLLSVRSSPQGEPRAPRRRPTYGTATFPCAFFSACSYVAAGARRIVGSVSALPGGRGHAEAAHDDTGRAAQAAHGACEAFGDIGGAGGDLDEHAGPAGAHVMGGQGQRRETQKGRRACFAA